jgi:hypothetical protein
MAFVPYTTYLQTWDNWNSLMIEAFADQSFPKVDEASWPIFANAFAGSPVLQEFAIPNAAGFDTWQEWANQVLVVTNGPSN